MMPSEENIVAIFEIRAIMGIRLQMEYSTGPSAGQVAGPIRTPN
jgi:hypothetical protein